MNVRSVRCLEMARDWGLGIRDSGLEDHRQIDDRRGNDCMIVSSIVVEYHYRYIYHQHTKSSNANTVSRSQRAPILLDLQHIATHTLYL